MPEHSPAEKKFGGRWRSSFSCAYGLPPRRIKVTRSSGNRVNFDSESPQASHILWCEFRIGHPSIEVAQWGKMDGARVRPFRGIGQEDFLFATFEDGLLHFCLRNLGCRTTLEGNAGCSDEGEVSANEGENTEGASPNQRTTDATKFPANAQKLCFAVEGECGEGDGMRDDSHILPAEEGFAGFETGGARIDENAGAGWNERGGQRGNRFFGGVISQQSLVEGNLCPRISGIEHSAMHAQDVAAFLQVGQVAPQRGWGDFYHGLKVGEIQPAVFPDHLANRAMSFVGEHS